MKVAQPCPTLWDPHGLYSPRNSPGQSTGLGSLSLLQGIFPTQGLNPGVLNCRQILLKLMSIESVISSSHLILCHPLLLLPSIFPNIRVFSNELFELGGQSIEVSSSASVLPMNIQDWFLLGWTDLISFQSKRLSRVFSSTIVRRHQFFGAPLSLRSSSHNCRWHWEDHSLHYVDLCQQSKVSALCPVVSIYI